MSDFTKKSLLFGIIGVVLASFIGYHNIYRPKQAQVQAIKLLIRQENNERQEKIALDKQLDLVGEYRKQLAPASEVSWLVKQLVDAAKETGVELNSLVPRNLSHNGDLTTIAVSVQFIASYKQLGVFVDYLENNAHYIHIDSLQLHKKAISGVARYSYRSDQSDEAGMYEPDGWLAAYVDLTISSRYLSILFPHGDQSEVSM